MSGVVLVAIIYGGWTTILRQAQDERGVGSYHLRGSVGGYHLWGLDNREWVS